MWQRKIFWKYYNPIFLLTLFIFLCCRTHHYHLPSFFCLCMYIMRGCLVHHLSKKMEIFSDSWFAEYACNLIVEILYTKINQLLVKRRFLLYWECGDVKNKKKKSTGRPHSKASKKKSEYLFPRTRWPVTCTGRPWLTWCATPADGLCSRVKMNLKRNEIYARQFNISLSPFTFPNLVSWWSLGGC